MSEYIEYVLWELKNSLGLVFIAGIMALSALSISYFVYKKKYNGENAFPWRKVFLWLIFTAYLSIVLYATFLRHAGGYREWNLHLFRAWREAWNDFSAKNWANVLLNIAMFIPLGFLLPLLFKKLRKWYLSIPVGLGLSLAIELLQLSFSRGICDIDDLFANTLGTFIGFFAFMAVHSLSVEKGRRMRAFVTYGFITIAPIIAIVTIFATYHLKEYGNLPNAAAYTNNTNGIQWTLNCDLATETNSASVYRTQALTEKDCDALANELAALIGDEVAMTSYYQEMAYYNLYRGILKVFYYDGSFEISVSDHNQTQWPVTSREDIIKALAYFPIEIPKSAEFRSEGDGWYSFTCDKVISGSVMLDGTLRCRFSADGLIRQIDNHLVWYTYYKDTPVISPQDAYSLLRKGKFNDGGFLEYQKPTDIYVTSCSMDYAIDTKGFYQPVYLFTVTSNDGNYESVIMIPAIK